MRIICRFASLLVVPGKVNIHIIAIYYVIIISVKQSKLFKRGRGGKVRAYKN